MATSTAVPQEQGLSEPQRIINIFLAPSKTFDDLKRNASWWAPWLLGALFTLAFVYSVDKKIGFEQSTLNQIAMSKAQTEQLERLPADQRAQQIAMRTAGTKYFSYGFPVLVLLVDLLIAGVILGIFNLGFGAALPFKRVLAIVFYAGLPFLISTVLAIVSMQFIDPESFNVSNPVATNPAYFMDPYTSSKFLYGILSAFDIFVLWVIALMAIGISRNSKVETGSAFGAIFAVYFLMKLIGAGFASMF
jgi:hypothetical protein